MGVPERQCVGCGSRGPQSGFVRLAVVSEDGCKRVVPAEGRAHEGRGAYLCSREACLERALMRKAFQRAFRISVEVDKERLRTAIRKKADEGPEGPIVGR